MGKVAIVQGHESRAIAIGMSLHEYDNSWHNNVCNYTVSTPHVYVHTLFKSVVGPNLKTLKWESLF